MYSFNKNVWEANGIQYFGCPECDYDECTACVAKAQEGGPVGTML